MSRIEIAPFMGRDVMVVTTSGGRYKGKLVSLDHRTMTFSLEDVWIIGPENRPVEMYMPASNGQKTYITFRLDQVAQFQLIDLLDRVVDPAIISTTSASDMVVQTSPKRPSVMRTAQLPPAQVMTPGVPRQRIVDLNLLMRQASQKGNAARGGQRQQGGNSSRRQPNRNMNQDGPNRDRNRKQQQQQQQQQQGAQRGAAGTNTTKKQKQAKNQNKGSRHVSFVADSSMDRGLNRRQYTHVPLIPQNRRQVPKTPNSPVSKSQPKSAPGMFPKQKNPKKLYKDDFDFDQANAKFKELSLNNKKNDKAEDDAKENDVANESTSSKDGSGEPVHELKGPAYNHGKSFFDTLSMTTGSESQQRLTRRQVMQANKETFGIAYVPGRRGFFRGRNGNFRRPNQRNGFGQQPQRTAMVH